MEWVSENHPYLHEQENFSDFNRFKHITPLARGVTKCLALHQLSTDVRRLLKSQKGYSPGLLSS